jgi:hypothetical protein
MATRETIAPDRAAPAPPLALVCSVSGGALLVLSAFLPEHEVPAHVVPVKNTLWQSGPGWSFVGAGVLVGTLAWRAYSRRRCSWVGFWVGPLVLFTVFKSGVDGGVCTRLLMCVKAEPGSGLYVASVAGVLALVGWGIALIAVRLHHSAQPQPSDEPLTPAKVPAGQIRPPPVGSAAWSLVAYAGLSLALFGAPVLAHLDSRIVAANGIDPSSHMWFFAWWPHAVLHGSNPFITKAIFAPEGYNLAWVTSIPGPSLLMSPVTLIFGPVVTWNLLTLSAPTVAAWTAFLLCRHFSRAVVPALAGGYLFGFSPYMLQMLEGSPNLYLVALLPLVVLLVIRRIDGSLSERWFVVLTAVAVAMQALTSLEILLTASLFGTIALLGGYGLFPDYRAALARSVKLLIVAFLAAGVIVAPMLFNLAFRPHVAPAQSQPIFAVDLLSWFLPNGLVAVASNHRAGGLPGYYGGPAYLGIPLAILVLAYAWRYRHERSARLLVLCFLVPAVASLGGRLVLAGRSTAAGLPWALFDDIPGLDRAVPQRFPVFTSLAAAVILAVWLARAHGRTRWALGALALVCILPDIGNSAWRYTLSREPSFFSAGRYHRYLQAADRVIVYPLFDGERWQAQEGFGFRLAGGYVGAFPPSYQRYRIFGTFITGVPPPDYASQLRRFVIDKGVTAVVVAKGSEGSLVLRLFGSLGVQPVDTDGVLLYRLRAVGRAQLDDKRQSSTRSSRHRLSSCHGGCSARSST